MKMLKLWDGTYINPMHVISVMPIFNGIRLYVMGLQSEFFEIQANSIDDAREKADEIVRKIELALQGTA